MKLGPENKWFKTWYLEIINFRFQGRKSQTRQKLAKRSLILQYNVAQKTSLILQVSTHLTLLKIFSRKTDENLTLQIYQQTCFCLMSEKTIALHYF